jgi:D-galactose 1-dehydrogenase
MTNWKAGFEGSDRPVRIALVGFGKIARDQHVPAIEQSGRFELHAIADPAATHPHLPSFASLAELLEAGPPVDAVALCQPPVYRFEAAEQAIAAGLHVLLEKPPGLTPGEVKCLESLAAERGVSLYAAWHSRKASAVARAGEIVRGNPPHRIAIEWREDIRKWHPGQEWILAPGGFGVFDPAINALAILTALLDGPIRVARCELAVPSNREAPIAARLTMSSLRGVPIEAAFDFLEPGEEVWTIRLESTGGTLSLSQGGNRLEWQGEVYSAPDREYPGLYADFAAAIEEGRSDVDLRPLETVADAFLLATRTQAPPFSF